MPIESANKIGSLLNNWITIVGAVVVAFSTCAGAYYMILINTADIHDMEVKYDREIELLEQRSEKRYKRLVNRLEKHEGYGLGHEKRILQLEKGDAALNARIDCMHNK